MQEPNRVAASDAAGQSISPTSSLPNNDLTSQPPQYQVTEYPPTYKDASQQQPQMTVQQVVTTENSLTMFRIPEQLTLSQVVFVVRYVCVVANVAFCWHSVLAEHNSMIYKCIIIILMADLICIKTIKLLMNSTSLSAHAVGISTPTSEESHTTRYLNPSEAYPANQVLQAKATTDSFQVQSGEPATYDFDQQATPTTIHEYPVTVELGGGDAKEPKRRWNSKLLEPRRHVVFPQIRVGFWPFDIVIQLIEWIFYIVFRMVACLFSFIFDLLGCIFGCLGVPIKKWVVLD